MDQTKIESYLAKNGAKLPEEKIVELKDLLAKLNDDQFISIDSLDLKNPSTMIIVAWLGACIGLDRFMLGDTGLGVLKLLLCGGCGIWGIIDIFSAKKRTKAYNYKKVKEALAAQGIA